MNEVKDELMNLKDQFDGSEIEEQMAIIAELKERGFEREARILTLEFVSRVYREGGSFTQTSDGKNWIMKETTDWFGENAVEWLELPKSIEVL